MLFPKQHPVVPPRVIITGAGIITALGCGWNANAEGFRTGRTAFRPVTIFDVTRQRVKIAAQSEIPPVPQTKLSPNQTRRLDRAAQLLLHAASEAWIQSGWENLAQSDQEIPIILGTTSGGMALGEAYYQQAIAPPHSRKHQASRVIHYLAQQQALDLAVAFDIRGPVNIIANACASGANAVGHAFELIQRGHATRVLTGGYDALCHMVFAGFDSLQALSPTTCRPFDQNRDGLALGEGAAVFTLETLESAQKRGANILGEIVGYGAATDAHHLTQPHPQGDAALASMNAACASANISAAQIGYINAHGTGTPLNDSAEAAAINRWAGEHVAKIPVSSTKASIGHLLGAAGAVEVAVCLMALRGQWLPPEVSLKTTDPACQFPVVQKPTTAEFDYALTNSFGFGGANATVILKK